MNVNRTLRYKLFYAVALLALALAAGLIGLQTRVGGLMRVAMLLLLPGRIGGHYLSDLLRSAIWPVKPGSMWRSMPAPRFLRAYEGNHGAGISSGCFGFYSWNVEAMARNNIAAARMQLGEIERAEADLPHAVAKIRTSRCHTSTPPSSPMYKGM
jgi:hypothetical protein